MRVICLFESTFTRYNSELLENKKILLDILMY